MKKKIFVYLGIRNENSSLTQFVNTLLQKIKDKRLNAEIDVFHATDVVINHSTGCKNCFTKGTCDLDNNPEDDMKLIKQKMLEADFIILASPVYSHNVSGDMKVFIDRISYWCHILRLSGKPGVLIASGVNGTNHVLDYLEKVSLFMGVITIERIGVNPNFPFNDEQIEMYANTISNYIRSDQILQSNSTIEKTFSTLKSIYINYPKDHVEYIYWKESGLFDCYSFQEVINRQYKVRS